MNRSNSWWQDFNELNELTKDDPATNSDVQKCRKAMFAARHDIEYIKRAIQTATSDELPELIKDSRKKLDQDINEAFSAGLLELANKSALKADDTESRKLRQKIQLLLKYALGLSILMGIFGATMFSKHLVGRLNRLGNNAARLARGEPLTPVEEGTDEVAELDRSFHYAADLISQATRMRQEVTAMITHDLKTPLQSIRSFLEMLHHGLLGELNDQGESLLVLSEKESMRMVGLIDSVLQLEKMRTGNVKLRLTPIDISELLDRCQDAVALLAGEKEVDLKREYAQAKGIQIQADAFWLQQVVVNILSNAIKFSPTKAPVITAVQTTATEVVIRNLR